MSKTEYERIYSIAFTARDAEIRRLEAERKDIAEELEALVTEYVKAGGDKKLLRKRRKLSPLLLDGFEDKK
jgi:uncharacterized protein (UPF0335 family)